MTNRTVQIMGYGYDVNPAQITVTLDGTEVFSGAIPTLNEPVPSFATLFPTVVICSVEIPVTFQGNIPMTCSVTSGNVVFAEMFANYAKIINPVFSAEELAILESSTSTWNEQLAVYSAHATPPFTPAEVAVLETSDPALWPEKQAILANHGVALSISSGADGFTDINGGPDCRFNITIDGVAQTPTYGPGLDGTWWWLIHPGSVLAYDLNVVAGLE